MRIPSISPTTDPDGVRAASLFGTGATLTRSRLMCLLLVGVTVGVIGCSDDDEKVTGPDEADEGSIQIDVEPNDADAPWRITGPGRYAHDGAGDALLSSLARGSYALTWQPTAGFDPPTPSTVSKVLESGGMISFAGFYIRQSGVVVVDVEPDAADAPWLLISPQAVLAAGRGDSTLTNVDVGEYTIEWSPLPGWLSPSPSEETQTLEDDASLMFTGTYVQRTGTIAVDVEPDEAEGEWTLIGPEGVVDQGGSDRTLTDLIVGEYTIEWSPVAGWTSPSPLKETQTLEGGASLTFTGTYGSQTGTLVVDPDPDHLDAAWVLTGYLEQGESYRLEGRGHRRLQDQETGLYTIEWMSVPGWVLPSPQTAFLSPDDTVTFQGEYIEQSVPPEPATFVEISAGTFEMGSPLGEPGRRDNEIQHTVTLTTAYQMQSTEVTNAQYAELAQWAVDNGHATATSSSLRDALDGSTAELLDLDDPDCEISYNGAQFVVDAGKENHPVVEVSWYGAAAYCDWLSLREDLPRAYDHSTWLLVSPPHAVQGYRLPREAEWEYACRAGTTTAFANGPITDTGCADPNLDDVGWYCGNTNSTQAVGQKQANAWGLYDMHGNVWESCSDWYEWHDRVVRGGSWTDDAQYCRSAVRGGSGDPGGTSGRHGFRPVRSVF